MLHVQRDLLAEHVRARAHAVDLLLISAGFDAADGDVQGKMLVTPDGVDSAVVDAVVDAVADAVVDAAV